MKPGTKEATDRWTEAVRDGRYLDGGKYDLSDTLEYGSPEVPMPWWSGLISVAVILTAIVGLWLALEHLRILE